jgi:hypothetical protein
VTPPRLLLLLLMASGLVPSQQQRQGELQQVLLQDLMVGVGTRAWKWSWFRGDFIPDFCRAVVVQHAMLCFG